MWVLLVLVLHAACVTGVPRTTPGQRGRQEAPRVTYDVDVMEAGRVEPKPVAVSPAEFQRAVRVLAREVRWKGTPREAARALLEVAEEAREAERVRMEGEWRAEGARGQVYSLVPVSQTGPVPLTPEAEEALRARYVGWCEKRGGGDCLGLLEDGPYLGMEDRRTWALALAMGPVLDETREALAHEVLDVRGVVALVVWTVSLYCMAWVVPEPTVKAVAASLTVMLVAWLGLDTVWGLMEGWMRLATRAHEASTFGELREAGEEYAKVLGGSAARVLVLAVGALMGHTVGQVAARVKALPGFTSAGARWEAQRGGAEVMGRVDVSARDALVAAVETVEWVAATPGGALAVVQLKKGGGSAGGGRGTGTVLRHRGGNRQMVLGNGQRWHLPRGKSEGDIPAEDVVGDELQKAVTEAARKWTPNELTLNEQRAIEKALREGEYWLARLLEREARGRFVETEVGKRFKHLYDFNRNKGVDVIDPATGRKYEILSGTESNLARHGRRMAGEFFRMLTF
ncbi:hypothetical protein MEBOL_004554 [Melittangium boletus DSM 14713]|uniref:Uncharacterized protein n=1 Tax=Melittangium boletus DSM 14713 TaxID=1294270 RepID=A0A250IIU5_9BACT|nr:hypothetical protein MEBOL_004554 [Melittangium boletus DSM 14713]